MMIRRLLLPSAVLAAAVLAGCAGHAPPPHAQNPGAPPPAAAQGVGMYKVGNPYQIAGVWYRPAEDFSYDETGAQGQAACRGQAARAAHPEESRLARQGRGVTQP
jgi:rare lipoprotein A